MKRCHPIIFRGDLKQVSRVFLLITFATGKGTLEFQEMKQTSVIGKEAAGEMHREKRIALKFVDILFIWNLKKSFG